MIRWRYGLVAALLALAACGERNAPEAGGDVESPETSVIESEDVQEAEALPPVDTVLLAAPAVSFTAIEPSEVGVFGAPTVMEALEPLIGQDAHEEGSSLHLSVREEGELAIADVVRSGIPDDSVSAGHVRIEFRREPDGWFPTNAYRRTQCRRGAEANQWTTGLCP